MPTDPRLTDESTKDKNKSLNMYSFHKRDVKQKSSFFKAFKFACQGFIFAFVNGTRIKNLLALTVLVILAALLLRISTAELVTIVVLCGVMISLELMNTAVEAAVDVASPEYSHLAKIAKDCAAGSVLAMGVASAVVGFIIFIPKVIELIGYNLG